MHYFLKCIFVIKLFIFRQFLCPSSGVFHYTHSSSVLMLLAKCQQNCMTYNIAVCIVKKLLMVDRGTVRNM